MACDEERTGHGVRRISQRLLFDLPVQHDSNGRRVHKNGMTRSPYHVQWDSDSGRMGAAASGVIT